MIGILVKIIDIYSLLIVISTIGSWFNFRNNKYFKYAEILFDYIDKLTEPYLKLFKILIPVGAGSIDISPIKFCEKNTCWNGLLLGHSFF